MNLQKGVAPILIVIIFALAGVGIYAKSKYSNNLILSASPSPFSVVSQEPTGTPSPTTVAINTNPAPKTPTPVPTPRDITATGFVYEDRNDNGVMDGDDPRLPNMQIYFYDSVKSTTVINTIFTDSSGNFSTTLAVTGNLIITPSTYNNFRPRGGSVTISRNTSGISFGFRSASAPVTNQSGILEGNIYNDSNHNRSRDSGESSVFFYKLYLVDGSGNYYNTVEGAQTTDAGGHFKWVNLPLGKTFTIRLSSMDVSYPQSEYSYSLTTTNPQNTNIEIPVNP